MLWRNDDGSSFPKHYLTNLKPMPNVIETHSLSRSFGRTNAVDSLTLEVPPGCIFAFLGANGAGKTTTIKMLMNILKPTGGSAGVLGCDTRSLGPDEFRRIGYVSENQRLPEWMTVGSFIAYCKGFYPGWDDTFCEHLLRQFDLPLDRKLSGLSRGMKVKAALLTSLAYRPELLVLDEPFTGLDPLVRDEFIRGVLELSSQENWTVLLSSHDIYEVECLADRVGVLDRGRLKLNETTENLQNRFRLIEFTSANPPMPPPLGPKSWLRIDSAVHALSIVESDYRAGQSEQEVQNLWPDAQNIRVSPMSLRDIFLELIRKFRTEPSHE